MATNVWDLFGNVVSRDLLDLCVGKQLGTGMSRDVYEFGPDPSLVIKFETVAGNFQNVFEYEIWNTVKGTEAEKWFAPVLRISDNGKCLLMKRTEALGWNEKPAKMPRFLTDLKIQNFGWLDGQLVAHDYGFSYLMEKGMKPVMVNVSKEWWKAE
ncbi:hypothetical protein [Maridesulfovibrio sp.]|uniref:hypothetical protein n=1 Tax=Maridesulfovibrio sp. TaxID=2795000 RepID=UPI0029C9CA78|nr:hypothetical protein [Maridesulfovibrio sp.]